MKTKKTIKKYFVHPSSCIDEGAHIGNGSKIWHFSHILRGSKIGRNCIIGQNVVIGPDVSVGDGCKIQNNVSIYKGVTLEDGVFCGPSCVFTNVYNPRAFIERKKEFKPILVKKGATVGANATIICGITIGRYSFIGAGAVVKNDIPDYALVVGVPSRQIGWVCRCGVTLGMFNPLRRNPRGFSPGMNAADRISASGRELRPLGRRGSTENGDMECKNCKSTYKLRGNDLTTAKKR